MGEALSRDLASKGWHVAMADLKTNDTLSLELGRNASFHKTDVADYESQAKTFQEVRNEHGRIDALLANAGIVDKESLYIFDHRDSDVIPPKPSLLWTDIDWKGVVYGTQLATHFMRKNKVSASSWRREAWRHYTHTRRIQSMTGPRRQSLISFEQHHECSRLCVCRNGCFHVWAAKG